nr:hypothetical protein Iba_chr15aCG5300 [Ipomoea batatas]
MWDEWAGKGIQAENAKKEWHPDKLKGQDTANFKVSGNNEAYQGGTSVFHLPSPDNANCLPISCFSQLQQKRVNSFVVDVAMVRPKTPLLSNPGHNPWLCPVHLPCTIYSGNKYEVSAEALVFREITSYVEKGNTLKWKMMTMLDKEGETSILVVNLHLICNRILE